MTQNYVFNVFFMEALNHRFYYVQKKKE